MLDLDPSTLISHLFVLVTAFAVHEFAHAWTANFFGDDTPRMNGRLTLNPLSHLDPIGSLLLLVAGFGWAKPVPVDPYTLRRRSPAALMWVSLAGPLSNLLMAILAAIPFRLGLLSVFDAEMALFTSNSHFLPTIPQVLYIFIYTNLLLMLFNLLPIAPLDGEKIADYFFPPAWSRTLDTIRPYGPVILLAIVFLGVLRFIIFPPLNLLMGLLVG
ncbi:MAG TPA: site-2 protease family protein [Anaerolineales bacterium]|nr:site-2 protease family protein [Anaerolineales bacterium]